MQLQTTHIYLIRHAEGYNSQYNKIASRLPGQGLTAQGVTQVKALREYISVTGQVKADIILSSDYVRVMETAAILAEEWLLPVTIHPDLDTIRYGVDDISVDELHRRYGRFNRLQYRDRPLTPLGESWNQFCTRIFGVFQDIATRYCGQHVVLVTHRGVIQASLMYFGNIDLALLPHDMTQVGLATVTHWEGCYAGKPDWTLHHYNSNAVRGSLTQC